MYDSDIWDICPGWFIPATFLWAVLDTQWEKLGLLDKLCNRFPQYGRHRIRTWMHRWTGIFSYGITLLIGAWIILIVKRTAVWELLWNRK